MAGFNPRAADQKFEETCTLKRKWLVSILAVVPAALTPLAVIGQVAPDRTPRTETEPQYKYMVFAGFGYTSLNQVNQSRYGLMGFNVEASRNWGRFFALTVDGASYTKSVSTGNPGNPSVSMVLAGPELHGKIFDRWNLFGRALLGGVHTGGESMTPSVSFAGGAGGGLEYVMNKHLVVRAYGDDIASSFSVTNNSSQLGYSPHMRRNSRAAIGIGYRF
jgi:hypothetical protein